MINLTHDEDSSIDVGGLWVGPDEFEMFFRFSRDDQPDFEVRLILDTDEMSTLVKYLYTMRSLHVKQ